MLFDYLLFLAKIATVVIALLLLLSTIIALANKGKRNKTHLVIKKLNELYQDMEKSMREKTSSKVEFKKYLKQQKVLSKQQAKTAETQRKRIFVLNFAGDIRASAVKNLREEVTAILTTATSQDEVLLRLESPGGIVPGYGLAAAELLRIRQRQIPLTIAIDKIAASGGYMMAVTGNKILAAPFAIVGSIGVIAQLPNFNELLKKHHIQFEQIMAGQYKRTLSLFGENTRQGRAKFQEEVDITHTLFKAFIQNNRSIVNVEEVATGEHWYASQAIELKLVDEIMTSDDYLLQAATTHQIDIFEISYVIKKTLGDKLGKTIQNGIEGLFRMTSRV